MRRKRILLMAPLAIVGIVVFGFVGGEVVLHLWNWLLPSLFGWKQVTFWQALGLLALCRILFGGVSARGGRLSRSDFRRRIAERWDHLTPEQREKFCKGFHDRWGREAPQEPKPGM